MLPCWRMHDNQLLLYSFSLVPTNANTQSVYNNAYTQNSWPHLYYSHWRDQCLQFEVQIVQLQPEVMLSLYQVHTLVTILTDNYFWYSNNVQQHVCCSNGMWVWRWSMMDRVCCALWLEVRHHICISRPLHWLSPDPESLSSSLKLL